MYASIDAVWTLERSDRVEPDHLDEDPTPCRRDAVTSQHRPYTRGCEAQSHRGQLTASPPKATRRVLLGETRHQLDRAPEYCWPARAAPLARPSAPDQVRTATKQSFGLHQSTSVNPRHQQAQPGEDHSVRWPQCRTGHLAALDRDLVFELHDLDGRLGLVGAAEPEQLEHPDRDHTEP